MGSKNHEKGVGGRLIKNTICSTYFIDRIFDFLLNLRLFLWKVNKVILSLY